MQTSIWAIRSISKGRGAGGERRDLQKCDYPIQERAVNCKITQSPMPLECWPDGPDWNLHGEVGLHLICSPIDIIHQQCTFKNLKYPDPRSKTQNSCLRCKACIMNQCSGQICTSYNTMYIQNEILTLIIWWSYLLPKFASMTKMLFQPHPKSV